jgi:cytoskeletal protein RodZ
MASFGSMFKKARKAKGISLDEIAGETRISSRFLKAIEDEEFHVLPGGIFNRGFIRAYAERIGLNPVEILREYEQLIDAHRASDPANTTATENQNKRERHYYPIAVGGLILLILIFYLVTRTS